jgi:probable rRNA maturation factor
MTSLDIQISVEEGPWPSEAELASLSERVLGASADFLKREEKQPFPKMPPEVSLVFTDDASIREINAEWRSQDKPTNVLSFPAFPLMPGKMPGPMLGDIILAHETLVREAEDLGMDFCIFSVMITLLRVMPKEWRAWRLAFWPVLVYLIPMGTVIPYDSLEQ